MKKQTVIIIVLCVLVAVVIALNVTGVIGSQDRDTASLAGYSRDGDPPTVSPPNTLPDIGTPWDQSFPTTP